MNQRECQLAGRLFDPRSPELMAIKHRAHEICREYNTLAEDDPRRQELVRELLGGAGEGCCLQGPIQFNYGCNMRVGDHFFANFNFTVLDDGPITVGDRVMIGPNVSLMATDHPLPWAERTRLTYPDGHTSVSEFAEPIHIGNNVWIACGCIIFGGVTIGDGAVIGAGSVVTKDVPAGWLAYGSPCRPIRPITEADSRLELL